MTAVVVTVAVGEDRLGNMDGKVRHTTRPCVGPSALPSLEIGSVERGREYRIGHGRRVRRRVTDVELECCIRSHWHHGSSVTCAS